MGDLEDHIHPIQKFSTKNAPKSDYFVENRKYLLEDLGSVLEISSIVWSYFCDLEEYQNLPLQRLT